MWQQGSVNDVTCICHRWSLNTLAYVQAKSPTFNVEVQSATLYAKLRGFGMPEWIPLNVVSIQVVMPRGENFEYEIIMLAQQEIFTVFVSDLVKHTVMEGRDHKCVAGQFANICCSCTWNMDAIIGYLVISMKCEKPRFKML